MSGISREPDAVRINEVPFANRGPAWALQRGVPVPNTVNAIHLNSFPFPQRMGVALGASPPSEWLSPAKDFPLFQRAPFSK